MDGPDDRATGPRASARRRRDPLRPALLVVVLTWLVGNAGNVAVAALTPFVGTWSWVVGPGVGLAVAVLTLLVSRLGAPSEDAGDLAVGASDEHGPAGGRRARRPLPAALAIVLVVSALGLGATWAVRFATGLITGNEPGVPRLVEQRTSSNAGFELTVTGVTQTRHFTRVDVVAHNGTGESVSLPSAWVHLVDADGTSLSVATWRDSRPRDVPDGTGLRFTLVFSGHVGPGETTATLAYSHVFALSLQDLQVTDLPLRGLAEAQHSARGSPRRPSFSLP